MTDVLMLAMMIGFFALAVLFIRGCERIVGPDVEAPRVEAESAVEETAA